MHVSYTYFANPSEVTTVSLWTVFIVLSLIIMLTSFRKFAFFCKHLLRYDKFTFLSIQFFEDFLYLVFDPTCLNLLFPSSGSRNSLPSPPAPCLNFQFFSSGSTIFLLSALLACLNLLFMSFSSKKNSGLSASRLVSVNKQ